jgi:hypothetical protein
MFAMLVCIPLLLPVVSPQREPTGAALVKLLTERERPTKTGFVNFDDMPAPQFRREPTGLALVKLLSTSDQPAAAPFRWNGNGSTPALPFPFALFGLQPLH